MPEIRIKFKRNSRALDLGWTEESLAQYLASYVILRRALNEQVELDFPEFDFEEAEITKGDA